ncbi:MAG: PhoD-like phosphatase N-terminal domain-containing protein [Coleofasciculus chthonoplastes F3-SA18-01]|uniref:PhoD-like phosphatase N-terminal domain-containing protein n=1 Tax=Coleofasciculus chthonoplastes TaxID=64178 RepID=UPI003300014E
MARKNQRINRRRFLVTSALTSGGLITANLLSKSGLAQSTAPGIVTSDKMRPQIPYGVASGDVSRDQAVIWSKSDRVSRMIVDYDTSESFRNPQRAIGPAALESSDYTARLYLTNLPPGQQLFYRVTFQDLADLNRYSAPVTGTFRTAPTDKRDIFFIWSGDTAGQGWRKISNVL